MMADHPRILVADGAVVLCRDNYTTDSKYKIAGLLGQLCFDMLRDDVPFRLYVEVEKQPRHQNLLAVQRAPP